MTQTREDYTNAHILYEQSLIIWRELEDQAGIAESLYRLGRLAFNQADLVTARALFEENLQIYRALDDKHGCASALNMLGDIASLREDRPSTGTRIL